MCYEQTQAKQGAALQTQLLHNNLLIDSVSNTFWNMCLRRHQAQTVWNGASTIKGYSNFAEFLSLPISEVVSVRVCN